MLALAYIYSRRVSNVFIRVCVFVSVFVCPQYKTKTPERRPTITKHGTGIAITVPRPPMNIRSKGQGHRVTKCKKAIEWLA